MSTAERHWRGFLEEIPWLLGPNEKATVYSCEPTGSWAPGPLLETLFPVLSVLLARAELTFLSLRGEDHVLFTWDGSTDDARSWLCRSPSTHRPRNLHPHHAALLHGFGGIVERSNEPSACWLLNQNEVLTEREASHDASFIQDYAWAFEQVPGGVPIELAQFYSIAREANGNTTLCHRLDGTILLFAPDHSFQHVLPLPGCPDYTLYMLRGAPTLVDWVETVATQWAAELGDAG